MAVKAIAVSLPVLLLAACGGNDVAEPAPTVTVTEERPAPPVAASATAAPTMPPPPAAATTEPPQAAPAADDETAVMPNVVGINLQEAQDSLQVAVGSFFVSTSTDLSGQGRLQVLDANWQVCSQTLAAGSSFTVDDDVDLGVVRIGESCP